MPLHGAATEHSRPAAFGTTFVNPSEEPIHLGQHRKLSALTPHPVMAGGGQGVNLDYSVRHSDCWWVDPVAA